MHYHEAIDVLKFKSFYNNTFT